MRHGEGRGRENLCSNTACRGQLEIENHLSCWRASERGLARAPPAPHAAGREVGARGESLSRGASHRGEGLREGEGERELPQKHLRTEAVDNRRNTADSVICVARQRKKPPARRRRAREAPRAPRWSKSRCTAAPAPCPSPARPPRSAAAPAGTAGPGSSPARRGRARPGPAGGPALGRGLRPSRENHNRGGRGKALRAKSVKYKGHLCQKGTLFRARES